MFFVCLISPSPPKTNTPKNKHHTLQHGVQGSVQPDSCPVCLGAAPSPSRPCPAPGRHFIVSHAGLGSHSALWYTCPSLPSPLNKLFNEPHSCLPSHLSVTVALWAMLLFSFWNEDLEVLRNWENFLSASLWQRQNWSAFPSPWGFLLCGRLWVCICGYRVGIRPNSCGAGLSRGEARHVSKGFFLPIPPKLWPANWGPEDVRWEGAGLACRAHLWYCGTSCSRAAGRSIWSQICMW